jgi:hypothetical protein
MRYACLGIDGHQCLGLPSSPLLGGQFSPCENIIAILS